jgi:hypothetical protein
MPMYNVVKGVFGLFFYGRPRPKRPELVGPAIEKGFSRNSNISAWEESGLGPFCETPFFADHIQATKGKSAKKSTLNYDVLDWSSPVHPQMMEQIGKGQQLTTGKIRQAHDRRGECQVI